MSRCQASALFDELRKRNDFETALADLLANARHFCDLRKIDFAVIDRAAHRNYSAEVVQAITGVEQI